MNTPVQCLVSHAGHPGGEETRGVGHFFFHLWDTKGFVPRWNCGDWQAGVGWLHIISDAAIFVAYAAIPAALAFFILRRRDVPLHTVFWLFVAFILSCGITHLVDASMFYYPAYRFLGLLKALTAAVSLLTAVTLVRVMPAALELPLLARAHRSSQLALTLSQEQEAKLQQIRESLETRSAQLTVSERRMRNALQSANAAVASWQAGSSRFLWESGIRELFPPIDSRDELDWARLLGVSGVEQLNRAALQAAEGKRVLEIELPLEPTAGHAGRLRVRARARVRGTDEPVVMTGLMELAG